MEAAAILATLALSTLVTSATMGKFGPYVAVLLPGNSHALIVDTKNGYM